MPKTDTEVTQLVINIGTTEKLISEMEKGNITENMLSVSTDGASYATLDDIGDATITIQKNGSSVGTFTANEKTNKTVNITVPTQASDIGAATSAQGSKADSAIQGVKVNNVELTPDANKKVNIPAPVVLVDWS